MKDWFWMKEIKKHKKEIVPIFGMKGADIYLPRMIGSIEVMREALEQCLASTSVLSEIESKFDSIQGTRTTLGGYAKALETACTSALKKCESGDFD